MASYHLEPVTVVTLDLDEAFRTFDANLDILLSELLLKEFAAFPNLNFLALKENILRGVNKEERKLFKKMKEKLNEVLSRHNADMEVKIL